MSHEPSDPFDKSDVIVAKDAEITALKAENSQLREALEDILSYPRIQTAQGAPNSDYTPDWTKRVELARRALGRE